MYEPLRAAEHLSEGPYEIVGILILMKLVFPVRCIKCNTSADNGHRYYLTFAVTNWFSQHHSSVSGSGLNTGIRAGTPSRY
jgi:hypothetical protein